MSRVLVDTGPLVALVSDDDSEHANVASAFSRLDAPLYTCWPVLTEVAWLLRRRPHSLESLLRGVGGSFLRLLPVGEPDMSAIVAILGKYRDARLQLADACLVHLAEREDIRTIFTLDRRDFSMIRLSRGRSLNLIP